MNLDEAGQALRDLDRIYNRDVIDERWRQLDLWGAQQLPDGTGDVTDRMAAFSARIRCQEAFGRKVGTWLHILDEEVKEAFAESEYEPLRKELIEVATVALAWVADLDRRQGALVPANQPVLELVGVGA